VAIPLVVGIDGSESSPETVDLATVEPARHEKRRYRDARASPQVPGAPSVAGRGVG